MSEVIACGYTQTIKFKQTCTTQMTTVFSYMKGPLTIKFMQQENTTPKVYCETLKAAAADVNSLRIRLSM
jgi:hypothetical protein